MMRLGGRVMASHGGFRRLALGGALSLAVVVAAHAHARLDRAIPPAGATVAATPGEVTLHFTEKLEPKFSAVVVRDAAGKQVDKGDSSVDEKDAQTLRVTLPVLAAGRYKVEWRITSVDTHSSRGEYSFRVGK
jgi:methionine-rich copper-binding protein CopC